jgi:hypothetical protein
MSDEEDNSIDYELEVPDGKPSKKKNKDPLAADTSNQVLIRATPEAHQRWKDAALKLGVSMSEFVRTSADHAAAEILDCKHPAANRRWFPWAETCLKCGNQLRKEKIWLVDPKTIPHLRPYNANPAIGSGKNYD